MDSLIVVGLSEGLSTVSGVPTSFYTRCKAPQTIKRSRLHQDLHTIHYTTLFTAGAEQGFDFFFRAYYPALCLFAFSRTGDRMAAEELAADAFMKTWHHHAQFNSAAGIRAYLYMVVKNDCLKYQQHANAAARKEKQFLSSMHPVAAPAADHHIIRAELARLLHNGIQTLAPECRKVFTLLFIEGKSIAETAEMLQVSRSTVKAQKARGLMLLRKRIALSL